MRGGKSSKKFLILSISLLLFLAAAVILIYFVAVNANKVVESVTVEAGAHDFKVTEFLKDKNDQKNASFRTDMSSVRLDEPGEYPVEILVSGVTYQSKAVVLDTIPPKGMPTEKEIWLGDSIEPKELVQVSDATAVNVSFRVQPDFQKEGKQQVALTLTDAGGNSTEVDSVLYVKKDTEAPVIRGTKDKSVAKGSTIAYRTGVTVTDNRDSDVELKIDSSKVDLTKAGTYSVTYSATDKAGNKAEKTIKVTVSAIEEATVNRLADDLLKQITTDKMTKKEKCRAIYNWARKQIVYVGTSDKSNIWQGAYDGFTKKRGDCYTYYSVAAVLLNRLEIPNMRVDRVGGKDRHYWNLVNIGEGWYHFDCSPRRLGKYVDTCLVPDSVLEEYSKNQIKGYYNFDHSLYPERGK